MLIFAIRTVARNTERSAGNGAAAETKRIIAGRVLNSTCRISCHHIAEEYDAGACFGRKFAVSYRYVAGLAADCDLGARHAGFRRPSDAKRRILDREVIYTVSAYDARRIFCIRNSEGDLKAINNDVHFGRFRTVEFDAIHSRRSAGDIRMFFPLAIYCSDIAYINVYRCTFRGCDIEHGVGARIYLSVFNGKIAACNDPHCRSVAISRLQRVSLKIDR